MSRRESGSLNFFESIILPLLSFMHISGFGNLAEELTEELF